MPGDKWHNALFFGCQAWGAPCLAILVMVPQRLHRAGGQATLCKGGLCKYGRLFGSRYPTSERLPGNTKQIGEEKHRQWVMSPD